MHEEVAAVVMLTPLTVPSFCMTVQIPAAVVLVVIQSTALLLLHLCTRMPATCGKLLETEHYAVFAVDADPTGTE